MVFMIFNKGFSSNSSDEQPYLHPYNSCYTSSIVPSDYSRKTIDNYILPFESYLSTDYNIDPAHNEDDILGSFLNSKKESLVETGKSILDQIYDRIDLKYKNLYELDQRICRAGSIICQLDVFELGTNLIADKRKAIIERELIGFEREKRFEQVACWRDISRLKSQLVEIKQQLDSQKSREKLIEG